MKKWGLFVIFVEREPCDYTWDTRLRVLDDGLRQIFNGGGERDFWGGTEGATSRDDGFDVAVSGHGVEDSPIISADKSDKPPTQMFFGK